jgi:hypothetical protein
MLFRRFLDHQGASIAPMFGLLAIPAIGLIGASVDYTRASAARAVLQSAADATALAMAKYATATDLPTRGCTYFMGQIKTSHYFVPPPDSCASAGSGGTQGSQATMNANGLAGVPTVNVSSSQTSG